MTVGDEEWWRGGRAELWWGAAPVAGCGTGIDAGRPVTSGGRRRDRGPGRPVGSGPAGSSDEEEGEAGEAGCRGKAELGKEKLDP